MITVNLLPIDSFRKKAQAQKFIALYAMVVIGLLVGLGVLKFAIMDGMIRGLTQDKETKESELNQLKLQVKKAERQTARTFKTWMQFAAIMELEERRRDQTRLFVELDELLPNKNAWFVSLKHTDNKLTIEGISTDKETVSQFLRKLENATYIETVNLQKISQNIKINNIELTGFSMNADTTFPQSTLFNDGLEEVKLPSKDSMVNAVKNAAPKLVEDAANAVGVR